MCPKRQRPRRAACLAVGGSVLALAVGAAPLVGASAIQVDAAKRYAAARAVFVAGGSSPAIPGDLVRAPNGRSLATAPQLRLRRAIASALLNVAPSSRPQAVTVTVVRTVPVDGGAADVWVNAVVTTRARSGEVTVVPDELVIRVDRSGALMSVGAPPSDVARSTEPASSRPGPPDRSWILAEPAWTPGGRPGVWVSRPYWGAVGEPALTRLSRSSRGTACTVISRRLAAMRSSYFDWSPAGTQTTRFCVRVAALRRDGRMAEFLASSRASRRDRGVPMVLPEPGRGWPRRASAGAYFRTSDPAPRAAMGYFNREATYAYAEKWWPSFNPQYDRMVGNDCANYVSQLLRAGGFRKTGGWFQNWSAEQGFTWTVTWVRARALRNWLLSTGRVTRTDRWGVWRGDVLMYDFQSDGIIDHTSMVTWRARTWSVHGRPVGWPLVTQHSRHYLWRSTYLQIAGDPDAVIGYYKIHSAT